MALLEFSYGGTTSFKKEKKRRDEHHVFTSGRCRRCGHCGGRSVGVVYWIWHVKCILLCIVADRIDGLHSLEPRRIRYLRYSYCVVKRTVYD